MDYRRDDVGADEFNSLSQIEKELLYKIYNKSCETGKTVAFDFIFTTFKPKYTFDEIVKALNSLREKAYLYSKSFYNKTFRYLGYSEEMDEL